MLGIKSFIKKNLLAVLALGLGIYGPSVVAGVMAEDAGAKLILQVTQGKAKITQEFKAVDNINGYVVTPVQKAGGSLIIYADSQGKYLLLGNLIDASGHSLSEAFTQKYVVSVTAKAVLLQAPKAAWFVDGKDSAPHKAYIFIDPNCIYCHLLYQELLPLIHSGALQVRWIPVGFLKESSPGKSAALLYANSTKGSVAASELLKQDELKFDTHHEEGGIAPLVDKNSKNSQNSQAWEAVKNNTEFFNQFGFQGTPTLIYIKMPGQPAYYPGYLGGSALQELVNTMGQTW